MEHAYEFDHNGEWEADSMSSQEERIDEWRLPDTPS